MKAAVYRRYGPPDVVKIEEVEKPVPGDNDVLVRYKRRRYARRTGGSEKPIRSS